ncbi:MAG TPA: cellulose synthase subunit BcsC-related outer membrane protein, partial [Acidobacteriaceae bacterium]|nr:cellulose synthase subunit BcsC-related outer membrane protein [Acidobacteriaceae bacterium]
ILTAAIQAFPDNLAVRKAVASGYLRAERTKESLELFKSVDFQDASASDFQGAIGAALAANDRTQAEIWLRQALDRYPHDASILASAARFEQARGDSNRAAEYWRASLAAMPQVSPTDRLAHELNHPESTRPNQRPATPDDLANLLNPDMPQTGPKSPAAMARLAPLPAYGHDPYDPGAPVVVAPQKSVGYAPQPAAGAVPTTTTETVPQSELKSPAASSAGALPTPFRDADSGDASEVGRPQLPPPPAFGPSARGGSTASGGKPSASHHTPPRALSSEPDASQPGTLQPGTSQPGYEGQMNLPRRDQQIQNPAPPVRQQAQPQSQPKTLPVYPQLIPQSMPAVQKPSVEAPAMEAENPPARFSAPGRLEQTVDPAAYNGLRLSTEPLNPRAAQAQTLFAGETDAQLNPGFSIHYLPNASTGGVNLPPASAQQDPIHSTAAAYFNAQYTPSAQDAAAGAYSAPKQPQPAPQAPIQPQAAPQAKPKSETIQRPAVSSKRKRRKAQPAGPAVPTLVTAPGETQQPAAPQVPAADTVSTPDAQSAPSSGVTDQELEERNLPPLRGPWFRMTHKPPVQLSPREEAEQQLRQIEGGYSAWLGGTGTIAHRTGNLGYDNLTTLEAAFEASVPVGTHARLTFIAKPAFLDAGQADGTAIVSLTNGTVPEPFGTGAGSDGGATDPSAAPPAQQNAAGIGGEAQLTFGNLAIAGGYTPYGFQISNWTARANWHPGAGPFTFTFNRDAVKDTQLSYAGMRDPFSSTQVYPGNVWGGVMANAFGVQYARGDLVSGYYLGAGGQYLKGVHVVENRRIDGSAGAYFRVYADPERGSLNVGVNFFAMHYTKNLLGFTYGLGGYFSPQAYFLGNIPITWTGHRGTRLHYTVLGSFGVQAFSENKEPLFPLDPAIEIGYQNPSLPALTSVGANYDLRANAAYAVHDHWFIGGFVSANNSRDYTTGSAGFSVRYLFRSQPSTVAGPTGLFPTDDAHPLRPLTVP